MMAAVYNIDTNRLHEIGFSSDCNALFRQLNSMAEMVGIEKFRETAVEELIGRVNPHDIIPEAYREYRPIVQDGLRFFLSGLSKERLFEIVADQMMLPADTDTGRRLTELAKKCPTLHKLCQIIARNKHVDVEIRNRLIDLENGHYGTKPEAILSHIETQVRMEKELFLIRQSQGILSEASVGAVCPFLWKNPETGEDQNGVFKVLKPGVERNLIEETGILEKMGHFFQDRATHLNNFNFSELFQDIRDMLTSEINLLGEQTHLWDAFHFYQDSEDILIPELVPFSNHAVTAMSFINGWKVTDAPLPSTERKACARLLFNHLILKPIFSGSESAVFHGDPHAGNILAQVEEKTGKLRVALVDWSLAGYLSKNQRIGILKLIQSVIRAEAIEISRSIMGLTGERSSGANSIPDTFVREINSLIFSKEYRSFNLIKKSFWLLDQAARLGIVFHRDLLLFRKSLFTLEGVLYDLDPDHDMDDLMINYLARLLIADIPKRFGCLLYPGFDTPENFKSLLTNKDLQCLLIHHIIEAIKAGLHYVEEVMRKCASAFTVKATLTA